MAAPLDISIWLSRRLPPISHIQDESNKHLQLQSTNSL
jgi:hypothetical protein